MDLLANIVSSGSIMLGLVSKFMKNKSSKDIAMSANIAKKLMNKNCSKNTI
jgi:hypothetical protein